ncbi:MAG: GIY-YIG nuclease family protein [Candidatus Pacebacteria bacterium]|nr:GIY-YIG nuclease family protein [Candidatus Paceibacterota bacterium]
MPNYNNGKIYIIANDINEDTYIGSTCQSLLCNRMSSHRVMSRSSNSKLYVVMRTVGIEHFKISLIEKYPCKSTSELRAREQYYIDKLKPSLNVFSAVLNKTQRKITQQRYNEKNKENIKANKKQYRADHKEQLDRVSKQWTQNNRQRSNSIKYKWSQQIITCNKCNTKLSQGCLSRHRKTKAHKSNVLKKLHLG